LDGQKIDEDVHVEGEATTVPCHGPIAKVINRYLGGLASGMTYVGANEIEKLKGKADFVEISSAGYVESLPHMLNGLEL